MYTDVLRYILVCIHTPKHTSRRHTGSHTRMNVEIQVYKEAKLHNIHIHRCTDIQTHP